MSQQVEVIDPAESRRSPGSPASRGFRGFAGRVGGDRAGFFVAWLAVVVGFSIALPQSYFTAANLSVMLATQANLLILSLAAILPLTTGDFDLSIAGSAGICAMLIAQLNAHQKMPIVLAVLIGLAAAVLVGVVNSLLVVGFGASSIVVTLGTGTLLGGVTLWLGNSTAISGVSSSLVNGVVIARLFGVPLVFYYALALCLILWYIQSYTAFGQRMLFVGQSRDVAKLSGVRVNGVRAIALIGGSFIAGLSGVASVGISGAADPSNFPPMLLPAFSAAFLGAAVISRGRFSAWGCFFSVYFLISGITGLQQLGAQSYVQSLFYGAALVVAVALARISVKSRGLQAAGAV